MGRRGFQSQGLAMFRSWRNTRQKYLAGSKQLSLNQSQVICGQKQQFFQVLISNSEKPSMNGFGGGDPGDG
jgi:hypothetical protein